MNNFDVCNCLKAMLFLVMGIFLVGTIGLPIVFGAEELELGTRFLPQKFVENSDASMYVYTLQDESIIPNPIEGLRASSMDSSIVRVVEIKLDKAGFMSEVLLKTGKPGETTISLVAKGFSPIEIPIEVNGNKILQKQILMKTIPDTFSTNGFSNGLVSVQLGDEDGFPVIAKKDTVISLSSSDDTIIELPQRDLIIEAGEYYALGNFVVKNEGIAKIYASSLGLDSVNTEIDVDDNEELTVELYVFPTNLNSHTATNGHVIAQLQDSGGEPVIAKENIRVDLRIVNDDFTDATNLSDDLYNSIKTVGYFEIPKGSYWGYTSFTPLTGVEDNYEVTITTKKPFSVDTEDVETTNSEILDDKIIKFESIPILASGNRELIGVVHLEDENDNPVIADREIVIRVDSSNEDFLNVENVILAEGTSTALVFADVGNTIPKDEVEIIPLTEEAEIITPEVFGPDQETLDLIAVPMISKVLAETEFPIAIYLEETEPEVFPTISNVVVSPSEYFQVEKTSVNKGDGIVIINAKSLKKGSDTINISVKDFDTEVDITGLASMPSDIELSYSETIFAGSNDVFSIQLLSDNDNPIFASKNIEIQLALKNNELIDMPETVIIEKGKHFINFDVIPLAAGETELTIFGEDLPLKTYDIEISSLQPEVIIEGPDIIQESDFFDTKITATLNGKPIRDSKILWDVTGALIQLEDKTTNADGSATISVIGTDTKSITIDATVSGSWFTPTSVSKSIRVNSTSSEFMAFGEEDPNTKYKQIEIFGFDPVLIIVPLGIGVGAFFLKKNGMLKIKQ